MKFSNYILPYFTLVAMAACSDDVAVPPVAVIENSNSITVDVSLDVAEISDVHSRAFSAEPDYSDLKLYVLEFERKSDNPLDNPISNNYTEYVTSENKVAHGDIHFNITIDKIDQPRVLHLIAVPKATELTIGYGSEGDLIPGLQLSDDTPAYWQRIEFREGYGSYDSDEVWTTFDEVTEKLTHVPMLCNFSRISVTVADGTGFTLDGFAILNRPTKGTVAPWNSTAMQFPVFLNGDKLLPYSEISKDYSGYWPYNQTSDIDDKTVDDQTAFNTDAKYIYERPHSSLYNPVIILKGNRQGGSTMYYKLDLGKPDDKNLFQFYNILRNFEYAVNITRIQSDGYETAEEALNGVVYNNFSFDVNTKQMHNVSNGQDMMWVNQTTFVVTNDDDRTITFKYKYMSGINTGNGSNENRQIQFENLETGEAIESIVYGEVDDAEGWRTVTITTPEPTSERKMQEFIAYNPNTGLGRTISVIVRMPWTYTDAGVWGGNYNYYEQFVNSTEKDEWAGFVSTSSNLGQPLTVRFHIDDNIPEALFPLTFTFESNRQNIENNKVGNLLVTNGPTFFDGDATTIKYVKTVTWADYNSDLTKGNETGTIVDDDNDGVTSHVVRARFQTILPIVLNQETLIRIYNPYMRQQGSTNDYLEVSFKGKDGTAPDYSPDEEVNE